MVKEVGDVQDPPSFALKLEKPRSARPRTASSTGAAGKLPVRQGPSAAEQAEPPAGSLPTPADIGAKAPAAPDSEMQAGGAQPQETQPQAANEKADKGKGPSMTDFTPAQAPASAAPQQVLLCLGESVQKG